MNPADQLALFDTSCVNDLTQRLQFPPGLEEEVAYRERLRAAATAEFSDENLCRAWFENSFLCPPFDSLPEYERRAWLGRYQVTRARFCDCRMPSTRSVWEQEEQAFREEEDIARRWAIEIRQAAIERQPCPFIESEEMTWLERIRFQHRLSRAFQIAGVVIVQAPPAEEKSRRRRQEAVA